jgi:hypothetical protein
MKQEEISSQKNYTASAEYNSQGYISKITLK